MTKRYTSWQRGEHLREWAALRHIHRHAPDLVPRPLSAKLAARPPTVTMALVPGEPLAGSPTPEQMTAVVAAVRTLWRVPPVCSGIGPWSDDLEFGRRLTTGPRPAGGIAAEAFDAALAWWNGPDPALLAGPPTVTVLGHRDPNAANYLWDGRRVRIVDFEDCAVSDPATEVAIMAEHLSWRGVDALCALFDVDQPRLLAARRLWAMFWLSLLLPGGPAIARNPPGTTETQAARLLDLLDH
ncbi:phosphotransferase [Asanoa iriomotensis]|uniref:Aminoglycoside phosphotransferase domain-containing protein n=1 Tax=Asanoa iriomotensis TaxID=234613 RepID=A0ABQ4BX25_9ACTN|nr:phosphotransferase [Asanoa iriomotensis]GIF55085.1 hypothetical protein Air01nite_11800 [Asanoa iriomotensis]